MEEIRQVRQITRGRHAVDGAGVSLVRVVGHENVKDYDPFLLLDAFDSKNPEDYIKGFPWHPHRGIETVTYLIEGEIDHGDSLGNKGVIAGGDCQWMTAGSGIIHQEMPQEAKRMLGVQLWLNMPAKDKMKSPAYGDIKSGDVPVIKEDNATIRIIAGDYKGTGGAFEGRYVKASYMDVEVDENTGWDYTTPSEDNLFIYIVRGSGFFMPEGSNEITEKNAVLFSKGDRFTVKAGGTGIRFIMFHARPLNEPIAWGGPIVMNTRDELKKAFKELDDGDFIKKQAI